MKKIKKVKYDKFDYHTFTTRDMPKAERRKIDVGDLWMNRIQCKSCKDIIVSNNRHDYKICKCGKVFVDGGSWYGRYGGDLENIIEMFEFFDDAKEEVVELIINN